MHFGISHDWIATLCCARRSSPWRDVTAATVQQ
jgi:hypothetical protein